MHDDMRKDTRKGRDVTIHKIGLNGTNVKCIFPEVHSPTKEKIWYFE